uniref:NADH-ubiquinone oxidoreductase chain 4 n=1 Tax=Celleporella hyalina TaxID=60593 RepID=I6PZT7_9BILA|nr:NADH dehydrogenase subunit 4 [Celleporella hyalina]AFJ53901.1 NADH dehydrogenase subunit 4 [Celleporella hyalina]
MKLMLIMSSVIIPLLVSVGTNSIHMTSSFFVYPWINSSVLGMYLTALAFFIVYVVLTSTHMKMHTDMKKYKQTVTTNLILLPSLFMLFNTKSMLLFFLSFEMCLLPIVYLTLSQGYQPERLKATFYFVMYTIISSLPLLFFMIWIKISSFSWSFNLMQSVGTLDINLLLSTGMIIAFASKLPLWGFHLWLPKAHVEAPMSGSMLLAALLLKLGGYGLAMFLMILSVYHGIYFFFMSLSIYGMMVVSVLMMSMVDTKKLIAYSSVIHMNMLFLGIIWGLQSSFVGASVMLLSHGFTAAGLFALLNTPFEGTKSRSSLLYKNFSLSQTGWLFFLVPFALYNMSMPPSMNFFCELWLMASALTQYTPLIILFAFVMFMSAVYNMGLVITTMGNNFSMKSDIKRNMIPSMVYSMLLGLSLPLLLGTTNYSMIFNTEFSQMSV